MFWTTKLLILVNIIFKSKQKLINYKLNIKLDNIEIEQVSFTKFLGVIINENLTWENHIKVVNPLDAR